MKRIVIILCILCSVLLSCGETKKVTNYGMNVTQVQLERYDTISSQTLNRMIIENALPKLEDWQTTNLTNYEENTEYVFYFYYDQPHEKMMSLKRLFSGKDTTYVFVTKIIKFEE